MGLTQDNTATAAAAQAVNALGVQLLTLATTPGENALLSPYSIQSVLAMAYAGAEDETWAEMQRVLHYPEDKWELHDSFAALQTTLETLAEETQANSELSGKRDSEGGFILRTANRLYGQEGFGFRQPFLSLLREKYGTTLQAMDFGRDPAGAANIINDWVSERTEGRILNVIAPEVLSELTRLVMVNAIYLKAEWEDRFAKDRTKPETFFVRGQSPENVPTMYQLASFGHRKESGFRVVALPYIGNEVQFLILLPDARDGLAEMEKRVTRDLLMSCRGLPPGAVHLFLPKFELDTPVYELNEVMKDFGLKQAFDEPAGSANFEGIAPRVGNDYLKLSNLLHRAYIKVNEKGTEAAAATVAMMTLGGLVELPPGPIEVRVDRPFLFAIQHKASGACLFMGRVVDPR
ncbi:MAG: proteinase [Verrucomicrobia bacterium]|jgi:serpin B|nr:proteinase [Verrucomicrobiota bacterium]